MGNKMKEFQCPTIYTKSEEIPSIFIAGGITNCSDWQSEIIQLFDDYDVDLLNPRRSNFDVSNPDMSKEQIEWEYNHLHLADAVLFYFAPETMCPITLYELGVHAGSNKQIFVTCHPDYQRRNDVIIQLGLIRPEVVVHDNLQDMVNEIVSGGFDYE
jgi:hypothetical protein